MKWTQRSIKFAALAWLASSVSIAQAGYVTLTNVSGILWEVQFSPITLTMKASPSSGRLDWLVFEDFFAANSIANGSESGVQSISISVNGGAAASFNVNNSIGTYASTIGGIDPNDLFINIAQDTAQASAGDTIVVSQNGTGVRFTSTSVPILNTSWNGQVAFWNNTTAPNALAMTTENGFVIPEPGALALVGIALVGVAGTRRIRKPA